MRYLRRESDLMTADNSRRIDDLIEQASDPMTKAILLVLSKVDKSLDANTEALVAFKEDFASHRSDNVAFRAEFQEHDRKEQADRAALSGGKSVANWMFAVIITLIGMMGAMGAFIINDYKAVIVHTQLQVTDLRAEVAALKAAAK